MTTLIDRMRGGKQHKKLREDNGRYAYVVLAVHEDGPSHITVAFFSKNRAEHFRRLCQKDADELYEEYHSRVRAGESTERTRVRGHYDARYKLNYPYHVTYVLEDVPVLTRLRSFPSISMVIKYEMQKRSGDYDRRNVALKAKRAADKGEEKS